MNGTNPTLGQNLAKLAPRDFVNKEKEIRDQEVLQAQAGKKIVSATLSDDTLQIVLEGSSTLLLHDDGQDCCEKRYMRTDDDLSSLTGSTLLDIEVRDGPDLVDDHSEVHNIQFLNIKTSEGDVTLSSHNENNGYYQGFNITATVVAS